MNDSQILAKAHFDHPDDYTGLLLELLRKDLEFINDERMIALQARYNEIASTYISTSIFDRNRMTLQSLDPRSAEYEEAARSIIIDVCSILKASMEYVEISELIQIIEEQREIMKARKKLLIRIVELIERHSQTVVRNEISQVRFVSAFSGLRTKSQIADLVVPDGLPVPLIYPFFVSNIVIGSNSFDTNLNVVNMALSEYENFLFTEEEGILFSGFMLDELNK